MKIAIIGRGSVGGALGAALARAGHDVVFGVRAPGRADEATNAQAASQSDAIILATPWPVTAQALTSCGSLGGKVVIDATNPLGMGPNGLELDFPPEGSGAQMLAALAPGARVVKCFNQTGFAAMGDAGAYADRPAMMAAGDDEDARKLALRLAGEIGFEAFDMGPLANARLLEAYAMVWVELAMKRGVGRDFAFAAIRPARPTR
ncbi:MAG: NAD(P)-binding domain-containing protein [Rhodoblastus sp.]|nr:MAG: NAD(P)-binding domain-containing protein [Rhodoblastus sp.]